MDTGIHRTKNSERLEIKKYFPKVGRTKSEFKESCDINFILTKYMQNGVSSQMKQNPIYGDFSDPLDYQEAQNIIIEAENQFNSLSSKIRNKFENDPKKFLEFAQDPKNKDQLHTIGIGNEPSSIKEQGVELATDPPPNNIPVVPEE